MNPHLPLKNPVGKSFANWTPNFANWAQLADVCQLDCLMNQQLTFSWQLATEIDSEMLPTDVTPCRHSLFWNSSVGEMSPLPTGEIDNPDWTSGCLSCPRACSRSRPMAVAIVGVM